MKIVLALVLSIGGSVFAGTAHAADQTAICENLQQAVDAGHSLSEEQQDIFDECFRIPPGDDVTNFVPLIGPALTGLAGLGMLLGGSGSTSATSGTD